MFLRSIHLIIQLISHVLNSNYSIAVCSCFVHITLREFMRIASNADST